MRKSDPHSLRRYYPDQVPRDLLIKESQPLEQHPWRYAMLLYITSKQYSSNFAVNLVLHRLVIKEWLDRRAKDRFEKNRNISIRGDAQ